MAPTTILLRVIEHIMCTDVLSVSIGEFRAVYRYKSMRHISSQRRLS